MLSKEFLAFCIVGGSEYRLKCFLDLGVISKLFTIIKRDRLKIVYCW